MTYILIDALFTTDCAVSYMPGDRSTLIVESPDGGRFTVNVQPLNEQAKS
jgi:hypothetical protein